MSFCKISRAIYPRSLSSDLKETGSSFKNWDSCMNNKACKIIAIVGICLAAIVALWLIGALLTCIRQGVTGISDFFCWCCRCNKNTNRDNAMMNNGYIAPNMDNSGYQGAPNIVYQPIQYPESAYYGNDDSYYNERQLNGKNIVGDNKSNEVFELEQDFDLEEQRNKSRWNKDNVVYDIESEDNTRNSFINNASSSTTHLNGNNSTSTTNLKDNRNTYTTPYPHDNYY